MKTPIITLALALVMPATALADYRMELIGTGKVDYYCSITVALENRTDTLLSEVNGFFMSVIDGKDVGRSRGASFLAIAPGARAEATFLTPEVPCDAVSAYRFVVGSCRLGAGFADTALCSARIRPVAPIEDAVPR